MDLLGKGGTAAFDVLPGRKWWCSLSEVFELSVLFVFGSAQGCRIGPWLSSGG